MTVVRYAVLAPKRIVNLTSPRYLPAVSRGFQGRGDWHDARYEPLRDRMEEAWIRGWDERTGHFRHLVASLALEGFRNPVMLTAGRLETRGEWEVPPKRRSPDMIVSEYLGGSRIMAASWLDTSVPAVVNDHARVLPDAEVLPDRGAVLAKFTDTPKRFRFGPDGVRLNELPYMHIPEDERYGLSEQSRLRKEVIGDVLTAVREWMDAHD